MEKYKIYLYHTVPYCNIQCCTVSYSTILYHVVLYSTELYSGKQVLLVFSLELPDLLTDPLLEVLADLKIA